MDGELRQLFRRYLPMVQWSPIETGGITPGIPDLNGCFSSVEIWLEMKRTADNVIDVKPSQVAWHTLRLAAGGTSHFCVRRRNARADELYVVRGRFVRQLRDYGVLHVPTCGIWSGGPTNWAWSEVLAAVMRHDTVQTKQDTEKRRKG